MNLFEEELMPASPTLVRNMTQFDLYVKTRELKQLAATLQPVMLMPKKKRARWVKENEAFIHQMLDSFVEDAQDSLSDLQLDSETMKMSAEFVIMLRDVMNTLQGILQERSTKLAS